MMRYHHIRKMDISNGNGIGVSLFVQGCHFHCKGCFNQETWDFDGGKEWTPEVENEFIELVKAPYLSRFSILGGEPMEPRNIIPLTNLIKRVKSVRPDFKVWVYTGYIYEDLIAKDSESFPVNRLLQNVDMIVDGQFELDKQDLSHKVNDFAGSTNQRIIELKSYGRN